MSQDGTCLRAAGSFVMSHVVRDVPGPKRCGITCQRGGGHPCENQEVAVLCPSSWSCVWTHSGVSNWAAMFSVIDSCL